MSTCVKDVQYSVFETVMNLPGPVLDLQQKCFENVLYAQLSISDIQYGIIGHRMFWEIVQLYKRHMSKAAI